MNSFPVTARLLADLTKHGRFVQREALVEEVKRSGISGPSRINPQRKRNIRAKGIGGSSNGTVAGRAVHNALYLFEKRGWVIRRTDRSGKHWVEVIDAGALAHFAATDEGAA